MHQKLPADPTSMILGVISIILSLTACCCSWLFFIPLGLAIIGLVMANKSLKEFKLNSEVYSPASKSNVSTARILNSIGLIISILFFLVFLGRIIFLGSFLSTSVWDEIKRNNDVFEEYDWELEEKDSILQEADTLRIEDFEVEEIELEEE